MNYKDFKVGDDVITKDGQIGKITYLFEDGTRQAKVRLPWGKSETTIIGCLYLDDLKKITPDNIKDYKEKWNPIYDGEIIRIFDGEKIHHITEKEALRLERKMHGISMSIMMKAMIQDMKKDLGGKND